VRVPALAIALVLLAIPLSAQSQDADAGQRRSHRPDDEALARVDVSQFDVSTATGGVVYLWAPGELATHAAADLLFPMDSEVLLLAHAELPPGGSRTLEVPVDATAGQVSFFMSVQGKDSLQVVDPEGALVAAGPGVRLVETRHMLLATVIRPRPGVWRLLLGGRGLYCVAARAGRSTSESPATDRRIELVAVDFVAAAGRPGHQGSFPVRAAPQAGTAAKVRLALAGTVTDPELALVNPAGEALGRCRRRPASAAAEPSEFLFECRVPGVPFRFVASGVDAEGSRFQRVDPPLRTPTP
jgi:hypothetical protein